MSGSRKQITDEWCGSGLCCRIGQRLELMGKNKAFPKELLIEEEEDPQMAVENKEI